MEEIETLVKAIAGLPGLALWVIAFFFAYKVVYIGSIFGVLRFAIDRVYKWKTTPQHKLVEMRATLDGIVLGSALEPLIAQIHRVRLYNQFHGEYMRISEVEWLRSAIDEKIDKDKVVAEAKPGVFTLAATR